MLKVYPVEVIKNAKVIFGLMSFSHRLGLLGIQLKDAATVEDVILDEPKVKLQDEVLTE